MIRFIRKLWCRHTSVDYLGFVPRADGFHVMGKCLRCGRIAVGKTPVRGTFV